jgi:hypothetical protein
MYNVSDGSQNTAIGNQAMFMSSSLGYPIYGNTAIGHQSLYSNRQGNYNVAAGYLAGSSLTTGYNNICIGYQAQALTVDASNSITFGNSSISIIRCATTSITSSSDARDKTDIITLDSGLNFVSKLNPVSFVWNMRDGGKVGTPSHGFIAQELQQAQKDAGIIVPDLVVEDNPDKLEASYGTLLPIMVKAIQELKEEVDSLKSQLAALRG